LHEEEWKQSFEQRESCDEAVKDPIGALESQWRCGDVDDLDHWVKARRGL
jgi:hypothetical protein